MRKAILTSIFALKCLLFVQLLQAQAPQSFSYQAVLRDEKGLPLAKGIEPGLSISLRQGSRTGAVVYNETYQKGGAPALRSNDFGIITLEVGKLKPNDFGQINWGSGPFFLEVKYDPAGGNNYITLSEPIQILSVPYAIYADYAAQVAPENTDDGLVFSGYYLARTSGKTSVMINATKQDSNISTLGGSAVVS